MRSIFLFSMVWLLLGLHDTVMCDSKKRRIPGLFKSFHNMQTSEYKAQEFGFDPDFEGYIMPSVYFARGYLDSGKFKTMYQAAHLGNGKFAEESLLNLRNSSDVSEYDFFCYFNNPPEKRNCTLDYSSILHTLGYSYDKMAALLMGAIKNKDDKLANMAILTDGASSGFPILSGSQKEKFENAIEMACFSKHQLKKNVGGLVCGQAELASEMSLEYWALSSNDVKDLKATVDKFKFEYIGATWLYLFCKLFGSGTKARYYDELGLAMHPLCPNPCNNPKNPCRTDPNRKFLDPPSQVHYSFDLNMLIFESDNAFNCKPTGYGKKDFECRCRTGYSYNKDSQKCFAKKGDRGNARPNEQFECIADHTESVKLLDWEKMSKNNLKTDLASAMMFRLGYRCICADKYTGDFCEQIKNPCYHRPNNLNPSSEFWAKKHELPGSVACREYLGNICVPTIGTDFFTCVCKDPYYTDSTLGIPNCSKKRESCDSVICHNRGICQSRMVGDNSKPFKCVCPKGFSGQFCEIKETQELSPWSHWSICSSNACTGLGWRKRFRTCSDFIAKLRNYYQKYQDVSSSWSKKQCDHLGPTEEWELCEAICPDRYLLVLPIFKMIVTFMLSLMGVMIINKILYFCCKFGKVQSSIDTEDEVKIVANTAAPQLQNL